MPIMDVRYGKGTLDRAQKADLAQRLTKLLIFMEGGAGTHGGRAFAIVLFHELAEEDWWVGGLTDDSLVAPPGRFLVHVSIPEGYMNQAHKNEVHLCVQRAIVAATGQPETAGGSILTVIDEVPEGNWGCAGQPISIASIANSVGLSKEGERFAWVRSYFAAKARDFAAAGYPADNGGLLPASEL